MTKQKPGMGIRTSPLELTKKQVDHCLEESKLETILGSVTSLHNESCTDNICNLMTWSDIKYE